MSLSLQFYRRSASSLEKAARSSSNPSPEREDVAIISGKAAARLSKSIRGLLF